MKKLLCIFLSMVLLSGGILAVRAQNGVVSSLTPITSLTTRCRWAIRYGSSYRDAPSIPTVAGDFLAVMSGKNLLKLDTKTGETVQTAAMSETPSFSTVAPTAENGVVYCPIDDGTVEAFDFFSMEKLWSYRDERGGQSLTTVVYDDGHVYTGFWNNDDEPAAFVCLDASTGELLWRTEQIGGFYWASCAVDGDFVVFGRDDGTVFDDGDSELFAVNKKTGEITDRLSVIGDVRSAVVKSEENGRLYFVTKGGFLYSFVLSDGGFADVRSVSLGGASTCAPVICRNRLYVGVQDTVTGGHILVADADSLTEIYRAQTPGYPQNQALLTTAYGDTVYLYSTYNANPGGIVMLSDRAGQTEPHVKELFVPESGQTAFCISTVSADADGTLYYKNDSGVIFALENDHSLHTIAAFLRQFFEKLLTLRESLRTIAS